MTDEKAYDNALEYPVEVSEDPYGERTVYDVEKTTFKNRRKNKKIKENDSLN
ncbi:MAG: hypothetical protein IJK26_10950 [Clostridia bacterium]|nr:hypothetical protein [Clostridia bacterium]